jgi:putative CocE/NonD family hydrolase
MPLSRLLVLLLLLATGTALAQPAGVPVPAHLLDGGMDVAMPGFARQVMARYHDQDRARYLGTLFRLQSAAGQYPQAIASIHELRTLRDDATGQPPLFLQYEIHAHAKQRQAGRRVPYADAWQQAFAERFGALDDRTALQAEAAFGGWLQRMRDELDARTASARGRPRLPLDDAIALIRAWQVHDAHAAFQPHFANALAIDDARRYAIDRDAMVRTPDGAELAALVVRPAKAPPLPVLLTFTLYANDDWAWADAKKMAAHGYAGVVAYSRGKGRSRDAIVPYEHEGADAAAAVAWAAAQPWSDGRVGMYGGSYSGYTQWAALKQRPPALKAIATSATAAPGIDIPMEGGVFLNFLYPWPFYVTNNRALDDATYGDSERWERLNREWYRSGRAYSELPRIDGTANPVFERWLRHPAYDSYWQAMTPQGREFAAIDIPVLVTTGYFDGAQIGALHYFREHLRQRPDADHTLLIGPYEHFTMQTGVPPVVQGYTPDASARHDLQALRLAWFDHVFKGAPRPELLADRVNWQVMGADRWRHAPTLEAMAARSERLYLLPGDDSHRLANAPSADISTTQRIDFSDRSDAGWAPSPTVLNRELDPHAGLVFRSEPLPRDTELAGPFGGELDFILNKADADIAIGIYEQTAAGDYLDLAWWLQRLSQAKDRSHRQLLQPGTRQRLRIADTRLLGRRLAAGSRLVVTLGVVKQPDRQLNLGSGRPPADETLADAGQPLEIRWFGSSHLDFPVRE